MLVLGDKVNGYVCYSIFVPSDSRDSRGNPFWILGDYFLFHTYTIFDIANNQVGFARSDYLRLDTPSIPSNLFKATVTTTDEYLSTSTEVKSDGAATIDTLESITLLFFSVMIPRIFR